MSTAAAVYDLVRWLVGGFITVSRAARASWMPVDYDPARFDLDEVNEAHAQLGTGAPQH